MMQIHLDSIRRFYPSAPILISKKGGGREEMQAYKDQWGVDFWLEDCNYTDALLRLLQRATTELVCIIDHDVVLFSSLDEFLDGITSGTWDLVGVEERIRATANPEWRQAWPDSGGWLRFAPGYADATLLLFDWGKFRRAWGVRGIRGARPRGAWNTEYHYGICSRLRKHHYLLPYHTSKYGLGNVLKHRDKVIAWHQWYGSWRARFPMPPNSCLSPALANARELAHRGEAAFLAEYRQPDFTELVPAWAPGWDIKSECQAADRAYPPPLRRAIDRLYAWSALSPRDMAQRTRVRIARWRELLFDLCR
jgi:hypothetical protein